MGGWLDATLGQIFNDGERIELSAGLNFKSGLRAVMNAITGVIDVSLPSGAAGAGVVVSQTDWAPLSDDSDELVVMAAGHTPGFYLVGLSATISAQEMGSMSPDGVLTWGSDGADYTLTQNAVDVSGGGANTAWLVPPALIYSDGSADIVVQMTAGGATGTDLVGAVRATATRQAS